MKDTYQCLEQISALLAQSVERTAVNREVKGSIPLQSEFNICILKYLYYIYIWFLEEEKLLEKEGL